MRAEPQRPAPDRLLPTRSTLIGRLKRLGDDPACSDFYKTYWRLIYGRAIHSGLEDDQAQEVVHDTVLSVVKSIERYDRKRSSFKCWLFVIVTRRIRDQHRKRERDVTRQGVEWNDNLLDNLPDPSSIKPDEAWETEWEAALLGAAMERVKRRVKPEHYQMFNHYVLEQNDPGETAKCWRTTVARVYLVKHRVRSLLKKELTRLRAKPI